MCMLGSGGFTHNVAEEGPTGGDPNVHPALVDAVTKELDERAKKAEVERIWQLLCDAAKH